MAPAADVKTGVPHLVLVGLPGVGKTTIGRAAAKALGRPFLDFDAEIERREGMPLKELFRVMGEDHFRGLEHALTAEVSATGGMVLAPGGGWITQTASVELLRKAGRIIYLRASPEAVARRLRRVETRPLLAGRDPLVALRDLYAKRRALYEEADTVLDTERLSRHELIAGVVELGSAPA
ncbi:MAG TPA: shikimate kinase [Gemmatimonadaceae bacterium]|nr:shikimate kinase [Gemmatimonadaceae bacterium]